MPELVGCIIYFSAGVLLYCFFSLIRRLYYLRKLRSIRVVPAKKYILYVDAFFSVLITVYMLYKRDGYQQEGAVFRAACCLFFGIISGVATVYLVLVILNAKYVYISDTMIIFPDCVKKPEFFQYRLTGNTLELYPVRPKGRKETYLVEENEMILAEILSENYRMVEEA